MRSRQASVEDASVTTQGKDAITMRARRTDKTNEFAVKAVLSTSDNAGD